MVVQAVFQRKSQVGQACGGVDLLRDVCGCYGNQRIDALNGVSPETNHQANKRKFMQDAQGKTLSVGQKVKVQKWDETDKRNPKELRVEGEVVALTGADSRDERAGEVSVKVGKDTLVLPTGAVNPPEQ